MYRFSAFTAFIIRAFRDSSGAEAVVGIDAGDVSCGLLAVVHLFNLAARYLTSANVTA